MEFRLADPKRKKISLGDIIIFTHSEDDSLTVKVSVTHLLFYPTFLELFTAIEGTVYGPDCTQRKEWVQSMYEIYTNEQEVRWGVTGIGIRLLSVSHKLNRSL